MRLRYLQMHNFRVILRKSKILSNFYFFYYSFHIYLENLCFTRIIRKQGFSCRCPCCYKEGLNIEKDTYYKIERNFKDTLFRMLFNEKERLLSLYNAISGSHYTDPNLLELVTLESAIYIKYKNDLAFIIDSSIHLYEHQSTFSPNLPLRNLFYIGYEYEQYIANQNIYSTKRIELPTPHFVVFYNGTDGDWEYKTLRLSDSFQQKESEPDLELVVNMYNINLGKNHELLKACNTLYEYAQYVDKVRTYAKDQPTKDAVERAIRECINEGILSDFLSKNRAEAIHMSIFDYDEEHVMKMIRKDERDIGREEGREEGIQEGMHLCISAMILDYREEHFPDERIANKLRKRFQLSDEEIKEYLQTTV